MSKWAVHVTVYHCVTSVYKENRDLLKSKKQTQKEREKEYNTLKKQHSRCIYQNEFDKACFQHDMACIDIKDLSRRTASDKLLCDKTLNIAKNKKI